VVFLFIELFPASAFAGGRMYCYQDVMKRVATGGGTVRLNGFTVQVKAVPDPTMPGDSTCRGSITSAQGKLVFEEEDWGMEIDPISGSDINGDGQPDAVLTAYSGGAHCCWTYYIVSLGARPRIIRKFENQDTASFSDLRGNGETEILIRDGSFDFGFGLDHVFSVFPLLIVQLKGTSFQDVGSQFWPVFDQEISRAQAKLTDKDLTDFLHSDPYEGQDNLNSQSTEYEILVIILDYLYSGRYEKAKDVLANLWPSASRNRTWHEMLQGYCSGLRANLDLSSGPVCSDD